MASLASLYDNVRKVGRAIVGRLLRLSGRRGTVPAAGLLTAFDSFVPVMPSVSLLLAMSVLQPHRWRALGIWFSIGAALGSAGVAVLLRASGASEAYAASPASEHMAFLTDLLSKFGPLVLLVLALLPLPMRSAVIICAINGTPVLHIGAAVLAGRLIGFSSTAWLATRAPKFFARSRPVAALLTAHASKRMDGPP